MTKGFSRATIRILEKLALNEEVYQSGLNESLSLSYRTTLRCLHRLKEYGLIKILRNEPSRYRGKDKNIWTITIRGLIIYLYMPNAFEMLDEIAEVHKDKLFIFSKWNFFREEQQLPLVKINFKSALHDVCRYDFLAILGLDHDGIGKMSIYEINHTLTRKTLGIHNITGPHIVPRSELDLTCLLLEKCKKDAHLKAFIIKELEFSVKVDAYCLNIEQVALNFMRDNAYKELKLADYGDRRGLEEMRDAFNLQREISNW